MTTRSLMFLAGAALALVVTLIAIQSMGASRGPMSGNLVAAHAPMGPMPSRSESVQTQPSAPKRPVKPRIPISNSGVGKLTGSTAFSPDVIARLFPNREVTTHSRTVGGTPQDILTVRENGTPLMAITSETGDLSGGRRIASVLVARPGLGTSRGDIGMTYSEVVRKGGVAVCRPGMGGYAGSVVCPDPRAPNIRYLFTGTWDGPEDMMPPQSVMQHWIMWALLWTPPA